MKNKGTIIAVTAVALVLLISAGIAIAAGVSGGTGCADDETGYGATRVAGEAVSFGCRNGGEEDCIRAENCTGAENGACEGDCDQEQLRERDCDGECDGDCSGDCDGSGDAAQTRKGWTDEPVEGDAAAAVQAGGGLYGGECAGDCDRDQDRLQDGSCDGTCDGDGTQSQKRGGS